MKHYVYPELSNRDYGFFRVGGPGLANCMFIAARAYLLAEKMGCELLRPTWERFGFGPWIRREKDKRLYAGLFTGGGFKQGFKKLWLKTFCRSALTKVGWERIYFRDLWADADKVRAYFRSNILPEAIKDVPADMKKSVAVHVRLGDFPVHYRTPISWYKSMIEQVVREKGDQLDIQLFSDGTDAELVPLLTLPGVHRVFYGNALADIIAISRCGFLIGSDSTFSTWGAFLGNVPCVFAHLQDCPPFEDNEKYAILAEGAPVPVQLWKGL